MAHLRKRYVEPNLSKVTSFSPIVGVLGHRQVGKTTLLQNYSKHYLTFDDEDTLAEASKSAKNFVAHHHQPKTVIDECQMLPSLFPALKERVRLNKKPGQFIISGSVRFTSRVAIRESLTGRIVNLELLPFTVGEILQNELSASCPDFMEGKSVEAWAEKYNSDFAKVKNPDKEVDFYLEWGGLPGICFIRNQTIRETRISEQLQTILDRDIRLVYPTTVPYSQILAFVKLLAANEGLPIRHSFIAKKIKLSEATQKKILYALESVFILRLIPIEGGRKGFAYFFEDQAESYFLSDKALSLKTQIEGFVYRHVRAQWAYSLSDKPKFFHYKSRAGTTIPVCVLYKGSYLAVVVIQGEIPSRSEKAAALSFFKYYNNSKALYVSRSVKRITSLDDRSAVIPISLIF